jgi:hypothetical protein
MYEVPWLFHDVSWRPRIWVNVAVLHLYAHFSLDAKWSSFIFCVSQFLSGNHFTLQFVICLCTSFCVPLNIHAYLFDLSLFSHFSYPFVIIKEMWYLWRQLPSCTSEQVLEPETFPISFDVTLGAGITQWYSAELWARWSRVRVLAGAGDFSLHHRVETGPGAQPASYPVGTRRAFPGAKATGAWSWPLTSIKCRDHECMALYLHSSNAPSRHGAQLQHRDNFTLLFGGRYSDFLVCLNCISKKSQLCRRRF